MATTVILIGFAVVAILVLWRPPIAIGFAIAQYVIEQYAQSAGTLFTRHFALVNYVAGVLILLGFLVSAMRHKALWKPYPQNCFLVIGLFLLAAVSYFWCWFTPGYVFLTLRAIPYWLTFIVLMPLIMRKPEDLRVALISSFLLMILPLVITYFNPTWQGRGFAVESASTEWAARNNQSLPLVLSLGAAYMAIVAALLRFEGIGRVLSLLRWAVVIFAIAYIIKTGSRGQLLALVALLVMFTPLVRKLERKQSFILPVITFFFAVCLASAVFLYISSYGSDRWTLEHILYSLLEGRGYRVLDVLSSYVNAGPFWWFIGLGNSASYHPDIHGFMPEVLAVEIMAEEGFIGFALFLAAIVSVYVSYARSLRISRDYPMLSTAITAAVAIFTLELILSFKQGSLVRSYMMFGIAIMILRWEILATYLILPKHLSSISQHKV